jgi:hypothetical protein
MADFETHAEQQHFVPFFLFLGQIGRNIQKMSAR